MVVEFAAVTEKFGLDLQKKGTMFKIALYVEANFRTITDDRQTPTTNLLKRRCNELLLGSWGSQKLETNVSWNIVEISLFLAGDCKNTTNKAL